MLTIIWVIGPLNQLSFIKGPYNPSKFSKKENDVVGEKIPFNKQISC